MKFTYLIIQSILLSPLSASQIIPKLCINCKFYTKSFFSFSEFGKCSVFPKEKDNDYFLVNGIINNNNIEYHYCSTSRKFERMCGEEGKFYDPK